MANAASLAPAKVKHPKGLPVLFLTEMWERFSFYCMLAILSLYMNAPVEDGGLGFSVTKTGQIYGLYIGIVYFTPLFGGIIADRVLGIRRTVMLGGAFFILGHLLLAFRPLPFFFGGLIALIIGNGLFKPNISTMLGNLYRDMPDKKDDGYNIFYLGINLGAFASPLVAAWARNMWGWHAAFATAAIGMVVSMLVFLIFQKYVKAGDIGPAASRLDHKEGMDKIDPAVAKKRVGALIVVFLVVIVFWMAFSQQGLTLTFWARNASNTILQPEIFSSINPAFILLLTFPLIAFWQRLRFRKKEPSTAAKLAIGMLLTAVAYTIMTGASLFGGNEGKVGVVWLVSTYAVITTGELCLSPMGLSLVSKLAPPQLMGMMMGGWFVSTAIGNYLAGAVGGGLWGAIPHSTFFMIFIAAAAAVFVVAMMLLRWLDPIIHQAEHEAATSAGGEAGGGGKPGHPIFMIGAIIGIAAMVAVLVTWISSRDSIDQFASTDMVVLDGGRNAHLLGVTAGDFASDEARILVAIEAASDEFQGDGVALHYPPPQLTDQSNDLTAYLEAGGVDVGAWMIENGYALADPTVDHERADEYRQLQDDAMRAGRGFWKQSNTEEIDGEPDTGGERQPMELQG